MDPDERNMDENPSDAPRGAEGGQDDDDFGDFEGFEGGVEHMQAQAAPSPWATFPDLLPVQTSPATPAEESQSSVRNSNNPVLRDIWHPAVASASWGGPSNMGDSRPHGQSMRTLNPPDVSLGTNQVGNGGRVTPDNVHDAAHAEVMGHAGSGVALDARLPVAQLDLLQQQLGDAEQSRAALEEQVDQLRQRNIELEAEVTSSQAQINELNARLQQNQEALEQRLAEIRDLTNGDMRNNLQQLQDEIRALRDTQSAEKIDMDASRQRIEAIRNDINIKLQNLESNRHQEYRELEQRLISKFGEECVQIRNVVENAVQQSVQQFATSFSQIVMDTIKESCGGCNESGSLMQKIKEELDRHEECQKKALEQESRRQLSTLFNALQSALQHLSGALNNNTSQKNQGENS